MHLFVSEQKSICFLNKEATGCQAGHQEEKLIYKYQVHNNAENERGKGWARASMMKRGRRRAARNTKSTWDGGWVRWYRSEVAMIKIHVRWKERGDEFIDGTNTSVQRLAVLREVGLAVLRVRLHRVRAGLPVGRAHCARRVRCVWAAGGVSTGSNKHAKHKRIESLHTLAVLFGVLERLHHAQHLVHAAAHRHVVHHHDAQVTLGVDHEQAATCVEKYILYVNYCIAYRHKYTVQTDTNEAACTSRSRL